MPLILQSRSAVNSSVAWRPATASPSSKSRAARCLFGTAAETAAASDVWVAARLAAMKADEVAKWAFDFDADTPTGTATSEWQWTACDAENLPAFYSPRTIESATVAAGRRPTDEDGG